MSLQVIYLAESGPNQDSNDGWTEDLLLPTNFGTHAIAAELPIRSDPFPRSRIEWFL